MSNWMLLLIAFLSAMLLTGDYLIKYAVGRPNWWFYLIVAGIIWCLSIYGWFIADSQNRVAIVGMLFSVMSLIGIVLIGIFGFNEKLNTSEWVGFALAIVASILLSGKV